MRRIPITLGLMASAALALSACGGGTTDGGTTAATDAATAGGATTATGSDGAVYVFLTKSLNNPYWVDARGGM